MSRIAAVVVTYNRKELLRESIEALQLSSAKVDVIVIDNNSTDGTRDYIKDLVGDSVIYKKLKENVGGAGGFSAGITYATKKGYDYIWIMDDDTIVKPNTLQKLLDAASLVKNDFGFLSSSVKWIDGRDCKMNRQTSKAVRSYEDLQYEQRGLRAVSAATFVSLLFKRETILKMGLPVREYFIWGDDKEYTSRISKYYNCYNVVDSEVVHKMRDNEGSNITKDAVERIDRYFYAYRNDFVTARREGLEAVAIYMAGFGLNALRVLLFAKDGKLKRLQVMMKGLVAGLTFRPRIRYIRSSDT